MTEHGEPATRGAVVLSATATWAPVPFDVVQGGGILCAKLHRRQPAALYPHRWVEGLPPCSLALLTAARSTAILWRSTSRPPVLAKPRFNLTANNRTPRTCELAPTQPVFFLVPFPSVGTIPGTQILSKRTFGIFPLCGIKSMFFPDERTRKRACTHTHVSTAARTGKSDSAPHRRPPRPTKAAPLDGKASRQ